MNFNKQINFLRFLTTRLPVSIIQNCILMPLYRKLGPEEVLESVLYFINNSRHLKSPHHTNLYVHVPFCKESCYYCHCSRCVLKDPGDIIKYRDSLIKQMEFYSPFFKDITMSSLYFGGGTPSLLDTDTLNDIFEAIFRNFRFRKKTQINFEAHPSSLTLDKIKLLKHYGVNRISLGVQALDKTVLKEINRVQDERMVFQVIKNIKKLNFSYINVDLIAGLPKQTTEIFIKDLKKVLAWKPDVIHITPFSDITSSLYNKINKQVSLIDIFKKREVMINKAIELLRASGYKRIGFEAYSLNRNAVCKFESLYETKSASILGLGPYANSIFFDEVTYRSIPTDHSLSKLSYVGYAIDKKYNMTKFITLNLLKGLPISDFKLIFKADIFEVFKKEINFLRSENIIKQNRRCLKYCGDWSMKSLFEYFSYTKILYSREIISRLSNKYKNRYNPEHIYSFQEDGFLKKIEDHWFSQLYYKVGL